MLSQYPKVLVISVDTDTKKYTTQTMITVVYQKAIVSVRSVDHKPSHKILYGNDNDNYNFCCLFHNQIFFHEGHTHQCHLPRCFSHCPAIHFSTNHSTRLLHGRISDCQLYPMSNNEQCIMQLLQ